MDTEVAFRGELRDKRASLILAAAAIVLVGVVGINLLQPPGDGDGSPARSGLSPSASPAATPDTGIEYSAIAPGPYDVPWSGGRIRLTMPAGWLRATAGWSAGWDCEGPPCWLPQGGATLTRYSLDRRGPILTLNLVHDVRDVPLEVCSRSPGPNVVTVGPTAHDLVTALANQTGTQQAGPTDVTVGGYPAMRFQLTKPRGIPRCPPFERPEIWSNATTYGFGILVDGEATVYVVDVDGNRLVITSFDRGASAEGAAQLEAVIASIEVEPSAGPEPAPATAFPPQGELGIGRHAMTLGGIHLSIEVSEDAVPNLGWASNGAFYISKSIKGPQGAEAGILWTTFPDGAYPFQCRDVLGREVGTSAADLAAAVAGAAASPIAVTGPADVVVGGRPAKHVAFTLGDDRGCQPGFFYTWPALYGGPLWGETHPGDTISVWIVDVDGVLLFIEGLTTSEASPRLEAQLQQFIDSIQFE